MVKNRVIPPLLGAAVLFLLAGCEQIFTYSPIAFLQRPVNTLTPAQQISYGQDALASGDEAKMADAYAALNANTASAEAQYTAAQLGVELSGVPDFITAAMDPASGLDLQITDDPAGFTAFMEANGLNPEYLAMAAGNLQAAQALGETLEPMDYIMGTIGIVIGAATQPDGTLDFASMDAAGLAEAETFITQQAADDLIASMSPSDPLQGLLVMFQGYADSLTP